MTDKSKYTYGKDSWTGRLPSCDENIYEKEWNNFKTLLFIKNCYF
jgi:hypothetical protein